jgi:hypothetical protein
MSPGRMSPSNIYTVMQRMKSFRFKISQVRVKFDIVDQLIITKAKLIFVKGYKQTFPTEILRFVNAIQRIPQTVYRVAHMQDRPIEGSF